MKFFQHYRLTTDRSSKTSIAFHHLSIPVVKAEPRWLYHLSRTREGESSCISVSSFHSQSFFYHCCHLSIVAVISHNGQAGAGDRKHGGDNAEGNECLKRDGLSIEKDSIQ